VKSAYRLTLRDVMCTRIVGPRVALLAAREQALGGSFRLRCQDDNGARSRSRSKLGLDLDLECDLDWRPRASL
jgi:hypothetical protein